MKYYHLFLAGNTQYMWIAKLTLDGSVISMKYITNINIYPYNITYTVYSQYRYETRYKLSYDMIYWL